MMQVAVPHCRLVIAPGAGHAMTLEMPSLDAGIFGARFGGG